jgi:carboxypeptidase C (cathepsin A)
MAKAARSANTPPDEPLYDTTAYGSGKDDSITDVTEKAAVTYHSVTINGKSIPYVARAGHLVTVDMYTSQPAAKIFYVSFSKTGEKPSTRPITFFYNGGPGSSSVFLLLGSFGPRRIKTSMPHFTPPAPYTLEDNGDSLLDKSDLVFINPVGTGYSTAIAPNTNKAFWGVDQDAGTIKQFIKRYLTVFGRWNSPKFLFGESYGTPRTCVLTWLLHEDGVDLNGVVLQSSILDYSQASNPVGLLPTLAADALYQGKVTISPVPKDIARFMEQVEKFARGQYASALATFPDIGSDVLPFLTQIIGIPADALTEWKLNPTSADGTLLFLTSLLEDKGLALGIYDGRVTATDTGIAGSIDPNSGGNDPTITAVGGVYTTMWNVFLNEELQYTSTSSFIDLNDQAFANWDFRHTDPTGAQTGGPGLYTAGDLAAAMSLNHYLKVFAANGYYDAVTPFFQTQLTFENMPLKDPDALKNLTSENYESGHMVYLDNGSRTKMKKHLAKFYDEATTVPAAAVAAFAAGAARPIRYSSYKRRFGRSPY